MLIKEFISETNKNQMISILLKHYKVGIVKVKQKSMKDHAHFDVDRGTLELSTRYKIIKTSQIKEFLIISFAKGDQFPAPIQNRCWKR